jgi:hypothetical protein
MSDHRPTFKVSPPTRAWYRRLTPLALALIGVGVVVLILLMTAVAMSLSRRPQEQWEPPLDSGTSTQVAGGEIGSLPSPAELGTDESTPQGSPAHPAWWAGQMVQDEDGAWWPPEEVMDMVREGYNATYEAFQSHLVETVPPDYDGFEAALRRWAIGPILESDLDLVTALRSGEQSISFAEWEHCLTQVQDFGQDGLSCTVGWVCQDGMISEHDPVTGQMLRQRAVEQSGLLLVSMMYDSDTGRWRRYEMLEFFPPE